jgi:hypothetical protein
MNKRYFTINIPDSFLFFLTAVFVVLKLKNVINWSWWFVFSPLLFVVLAFLIFIILLGVKEVLR